MHVRPAMKLYGIHLFLADLWEVKAAQLPMDSIFFGSGLLRGACLASSAHGEVVA